MATRIRPVKAPTGDPDADRLLNDAKEGWWKDSAMFGVIAHQPELLKAIVPVFETFFGGGRIEPHIFELMRLKTGEINRCAYCATVRTEAVRDKVAPLESEIFGDIKEGKLSRKEYLAVQLAEQMAGDPNLIPDSFFDKLHKEFSDAEIVELVFACSIFNWGNKFNITMTLDSAADSQYPTGMTYPLNQVKAA